MSSTPIKGLIGEKSTPGSEKESNANNTERLKINESCASPDAVKHSVEKTDHSVTKSERNCRNFGGADELSTVTEYSSTAELTAAKDVEKQSAPVVEDAPLPKYVSPIDNR